MIYNAEELIVWLRAASRAAPRSIIFTQAADTIEELCDLVERQDATIDILCSSVESAQRHLGYSHRIIDERDDKSKEYFEIAKARINKAKENK